MKKIIVSVLSTVSALPMILATGLKNKTGACFSYGTKSASSMIGWGLLKVLGVAVCAFIISAIFWWTYKWIVVDKGLTKRKKK